MNSNYTVLLFENEKIKVSDFRLPPKTKVKFKIKHPTIKMQVNDGEHTILLLNDSGTKVTSKTEKVKDKQVFFITTEEHNILQWDESEKLKITADNVEIENIHESQTYRQIIFEILNAEPKYSKNEITEMFKAAKYSTNVGTELLYENQLCRVWDFYLEPDQGGTAESVHQHLLSYVFVNVAPSRLIGYYPDTLKPGLFDSITSDNNVEWFDIEKEEAVNGTVSHGGKNGYKDRPMREYLVELK